MYYTITSRSKAKGTTATPSLRGVAVVTPAPEKKACKRKQGRRKAKGTTTTPPVWGVGAVTPAPGTRRHAQVVTRWVTRSTNCFVTIPQLHLVNRNSKNRPQALRGQLTHNHPLIVGEARHCFTSTNSIDLNVCRGRCLLLRLVCISTTTEVLVIYANNNTIYTLK